MIHTTQPPIAARVHAHVVAALTAVVLTLGMAQPALAQNATVRGTVINSRDRAPMSDVIVRIVGTPRGTVTDGSGVYVLAQIPKGTLVLMAQRAGLAAHTDTITVGSDGVITHDFALADEATVVAPVVVSATRERQRRADASATIDVLSGADVREARASHPAQLLKRIPGVYVSQLSGEGHSMAIRQPITTKPMYLYLEDGVPTRATGFFNHNALYEVNIPQSDGIEVLKGPGTALYGSDAIGGVVNVLTRAAPSSPTLDVAMEGGGFGYARALLTAGGSNGTDGIRVDANLTRMDGWRTNAPFDRQSGTVRWDHLGQNGLTVKTVVTGSQIAQNDVLSLNSAQFDSRSPINRSPLAFREVKALRASTAVEQTRGATNWSVTPYARYDDLGLLPSWQLTYDPQVWRTKNNSLGVLARVRHDFEPLRTRIIAGTDVDWSPGRFTADRAVLQTTGSGGDRIYSGYATGARQYDYDVTFRSVSPYLHGEFSPVSRLRIDAGLRYDNTGYQYDTRLAVMDTGAHRIPSSTTRSYSRLSPKAGASLEFNKAVNLFGSYRSGFRAPSQGQLFQQNSAANTVDLKPVTVGSAELGVRGELGRRAVYGVSAYDMTIENDIVTFVTPQNLRIATNAGRTRHRGIEGSLGLAVVSSVRVDLSYSVSSQRYVSWTPQAARPASGTTAAVAAVSYSGNRIEQAPRDLANALVTWSPRFAKGGRLAVEWTHTGRYAMDPANVKTYAGYDLVALHANVYLRPQVELFARAVNVLDRTYAELASYDAFQKEQYNPGSPRTVYAGMRYLWSR